MIHIFGGIIMYVVLFIVLGIISYVILYFVIKAAVRDGIVEARNINNPTENIVDDGTNISQVICPTCGTLHDMDYPKCPNCKHSY